jgi:tetratricopeptide (TPR) repeat protein
MGKRFSSALLAGWLLYALPLAAQLDCTVVVNTPEDQLMLAVNGADGPQDQITALDKYAADHADSKFMPCVNNFYTTAYLKLNNFDKAIEYGEKDIAANVLDINLMLNLLKSYVGAGKPADAAFDLINKIPNQLKTESSSSRPAKMSDAEWTKAQEDMAAQAKDERAYAEYAFFQLLPRVTEPAKRVQFLDAFMQAFPDTANVGQVNYQYFVAYEYAGNPAKADEYGEKAIAADPNNVEYLDAVANDYANRQINLDKASEYAKKVLQLEPAAKKPEGVTDEQFKTTQNNLLGLAHLTLGYVEYQGATKTRKVAGAIQELKAAVDLLDANPELQAKALYLLGNAYEFEFPANHKAAIEALTRAAGLQSSFKGPSTDLLAKVKKAAHAK